MKCPICKHGQTAPTTVTVTLERQGATVVFRNVPADVCEICGEQYVDQKTTARLLAQANTAAEVGVQVEIRTYAVA
ncbi:MAG: type II toxin-antitoxin system MqsA family antitoxin [Phycisphaerae bacterium]